MPIALIGLGSNVGDRAAACARAATALDRLPGTCLVALSPLLESAPVGGPSQRRFINAVVRVETALAPRELLRALKRIERLLGRRERGRWGPREIDADLLYCGRAVLRSPTLEVPHPRIAVRRFVLDPLVAVAPEFVDPIAGCTMRELRDRAETSVRRQEVRAMRPVPRVWRKLGERIAVRGDAGARRSLATESARPDPSARPPAAASLRVIGDRAAVGESKGGARWASPRGAVILRTVPALRRFVSTARRSGRTIGFVPTMGALHEGHLSLMRRAKRECDLAVVSIFVNPMQFGPREDFSKYPRDLAGDARLCATAGVDAIFAPTVEAMYPPGFRTFVDMHELPEPLCGRFRPGHFRGVMTVVAKLFLQVLPDAAYFGQKDFQQAAILKQMARDLDFPLRVVRCPIVREPDGLAMSSRNAYLSPEERKQALCLSRALAEAQRLFHAGERRTVRLRREMKRIVRAAPSECAAGAARPRIDYISIVDPETLRDVERAESSSVALLAVKIGPARLIDNAILGGPQLV